VFKVASCDVDVGGCAGTALLINGEKSPLFRQERYGCSSRSDSMPYGLTSAHMGGHHVLYALWISPVQMQYGFNGFAAIYHPRVPVPPLNGPTMREVIQPP
jgi:hypothetical protein